MLSNRLNSVEDLLKNSTSTDLEGFQSFNHRNKTNSLPRRSTNNRYVNDEDRFAVDTEYDDNYFDRNRNNNRRPPERRQYEQYGHNDADVNGWEGNDEPTEDDNLRRIPHQPSSRSPSLRTRTQPNKALTLPPQSNFANNKTQIQSKDRGGIKANNKLFETAPVPLKPMPREAKKQIPRMNSKPNTMISDNDYEELDDFNELNVISNEPEVPKKERPSFKDFLKKSSIQRPHFDDNADVQFVYKAPDGSVATVVTKDEVAEVVPLTTSDSAGDLSLSAAKSDSKRFVRMESQDTIDLGIPQLGVPSNRMEELEVKDQNANPSISTVSLFMALLV